MGARQALGPLAGTSLPAQSLSHRAPPRHARAHRLSCRADASDGEPSLREQARRLDALFYSNVSPSDAAPAPPPPGPQPGLIHDLPLWRVQWAVLPSYQEVLHVHVPHYCDLFNRLFAGPRPWRFGHLLLPGGSAALGSADYALEKGSKAPLVGTLMEVVQVVRFPDGRLLLLAAGLGRFKVVRPLQTVPHSRADVLLLSDDEELEAAAQGGLAALDAVAAAAELPVPRAMLAAAAAAQAAAAGASQTWWEFELAHCRVHAAAAVIDAADDETAAMQFGRRLVQIGSNEVVELPWAEQQGAQGNSMHPPMPFDEGAALRDAQVAAAAAAEAAAEEVAAQALEMEGEACWRELEAFLAERTAGLNSLRDRGVSNIAAGGRGEGSAGSGSESSGMGTEKEGGSGGNEGAAAAAAGEEGSDSLGVCLALERAVWTEMDAVRALAEKMAGRSTPLAEGLRCLRPVPPGSANVSASTPVSETDPGWGVWAGEGAHPDYPALRRVQRLSFALASSLGDVSASEGRQAWLEVSSTAERLRLVLAALRRHRDVLAAVVAVRNLGAEEGEGGSGSGSAA